MTRSQTKDTEPETDTTEPAGTITTKQMRELHALLRDHGITGDKAVHDYLNAWLEENDDEQHPLESRSDLSATTAARIIRDARRADVATAPGGLIRALLAVQAALPMVQKSKTARVATKTGGEYTYTYADLADVTAAAMPLLVKHGLVFMAQPRRTDSGTYELAGVLAHVSGEREEGALPLHGNDPQQLGGALTYHRRYLLGCLLGIVTDDDVDGRQAMHSSRTQDWTGPSTLQLLDQIDADAKRAGMTYDEATAAFRKNRGNIDLDGLELVDPWALAPMAESLRRHADAVEAAAVQQEQPEQPAATPYVGATTEELLAQIRSYRERHAPQTSWEEFSAKFRAAHGNITVDELADVAPERVAQWEASVAAWITEHVDTTTTP